ncbi:MAG: RNA-binding protein [archaeon]|nr:RNA-binding protein [archaeon]MCR4323654.1 RNA-binding protein [Nanoarchaeota archaeon]
MKLYVGNLPWSIDDAGLKELFAAYGVEEANLITDKYSHRSKGFGFVTIADDAEAKKAMSEMHEKEVEGRKLTVSEAKPMVARDSPRGNFNRSDSGSNKAPIANSEEIEEDFEDSMDDED